MTKLETLALQHPELRSVELLIRDTLQELIEKQYGTATITFNAQAGKITHIKKGVDQTIKLA